jgi:hypothetical protein
MAAPGAGPTPLTAEEAGPVVSRFLGLVEQARRADNPMAWLTQAIRSGGLEGGQWQTPALAHRRRKPLAELTGRKAREPTPTCSGTALAATG